MGVCVWGGMFPVDGMHGRLGNSDSFSIIVWAPLLSPFRVPVPSGLSGLC